MIEVSTKQKREFIKWFLSNYRLKRSECKWILEYISSHDTLLENIHFVENARYCERGIIMVTDCVDEVPFRFYKGDILTTNAEKCFHDIRLNRGSQFYIELLFKDKYNCPEYLGVLEDNPFIESDITEFGEQATHFLDYCLYEFKTEQLKKQIDEALDNGNKEMFMQLVNELSQISKIDKKFETVKKNRVLK